MPRRKPAVRCASGHGHLESAERKSLPAYAFGLPERREFPMYRMGPDGRPLPDAAHARNAKARASQAFNAGHITSSQKRLIDAKADRVLLACGAERTSARPRARRYSFEREHAVRKALSSHPHHSEPLRVGDTFVADDGERYVARQRMEDPPGWLARGEFGVRFVPDHSVRSFAEHGQSMRAAKHDDVIDRADLEPLVRAKRPGLTSSPNKSYFVRVASDGFRAADGALYFVVEERTPAIDRSRYHVHGYDISGPQWLAVFAESLRAGTTREQASARVQELAER